MIRPISPIIDSRLAKTDLSTRRALLLDQARQDLVELSIHPATATMTA
jgi:hypothetical protein